jgi:hypothetical protein
LWGRPGGGVQLRRLWNLIRSLPPTARLFDEVEEGLGERARWGVDQEIAWSAVELLDAIARKGTKRKASLIRRSLRPKRKRRPVSMADPAALAFFGGAKPQNPGSEP